MFNALRLFGSAILLAMVGPPSAYAEPMDFRETSNGGRCAGCIWFAAEGEITPDTPHRFREYFGEEQNLEFGSTIVINSKGGDLAAALELGRLFRSHSVSISIGNTEPLAEYGDSTSQVLEGECLSACAYAFLGAKVRHLSDEDKLGFHQFFDRDIFYNKDEAEFGIADRLRDQYVVGELISYLVEMDVSTELYSYASSAPPDSFAFVTKDYAERTRIIDNPRDMSPWSILPLASGLMLETRSYDEQKGLRFFCLKQEKGRVHVQILNRSPDGSRNLVSQYAQGTPEDYFVSMVSKFSSELRYPDKTSTGENKSFDLDLRFNKILSEPESGYHVNFDFTMSAREFKATVGADHLYFWPGHAYIPLVNFWGSFVASALPSGMSQELNDIVLRNCV